MYTFNEIAWAMAVTLNPEATYPDLVEAAFILEGAALNKETETGIYAAAFNQKEERITDAIEGTNPNGNIETYRTAQMGLLQDVLRKIRD